MEVDLRTIARIDEAIVLLGNDIGDPAVIRDLMSFDVPAFATRMVFKLSAHRIEAITNRNIDVFMSVVL